MSARKILAVGAHPDDIEFGCGGILIKETLRGNEVLMLNLSQGESGSHGRAEVRVREAEAAASRMGAGLEFLPLQGDASIEYTPQNALEIARVIRRWRPSLLLAPSLEENQHPDHGRAARLTRDAARLARYGGLQNLKPLPPHAVNALYYYDITGTGVGSSMLCLPKLLIDVSEVIEAWKSVMESHKSQLEKRNYVELQIARARMLGAGIGVDYAMALWANDPVRLDAISDLMLSARKF